MDSTGQTIDFLLTAKRDAASAKRFFRKVFADPANLQPRVINVDKNPAYPAASKELKDEDTLRRRCRVRQCKYLNNIVEQDHRTVKHRTWLAMGYGSFHSAWRTLQGIEAVNMIRKGRVRWVAKADPAGGEVRWQPVRNRLKNGPIPREPKAHLLFATQPMAAAARFCISFGAAEPTVKPTVIQPQTNLFTSS